MEQHPIPQNVIGFQFKLIGDMTIRQFLYLAGGVFGGYVFYHLDAPAIIRWSLTIASACAGFAFAFVPVEDRPLDTWFTSFFKSIYSPTEFLWKKSPVVPEVLTISPTIKPAGKQYQSETLKKGEIAAEIEEYLTTLPGVSPSSPIDQQEAKFLREVITTFTGPPAIAIPSPQAQAPYVSEKPEMMAPSFPPGQAGRIIPQPYTPPTPPPPPRQEQAVLTRPGSLTPPISAVDQGLAKQTQELTEKISFLQQELNKQNINKESFIETQAQLVLLLKQKEKLMQELVELRRKMSRQIKEETVKPVVDSGVERSRVTSVSPQFASEAGMPNSPTTPNVPSGIIKTQRGAILPGILVEMRDATGTPVRALKSGKLGQFAVSTPLPSGTYTIHLEDPQKTFHFDIIEITLNGEIVPPLEIFAKTQKDKEKEELKQKLFGKNNF